MAKKLINSENVLRYGLASVFLWFGYSQLINPSDWVGWVPLWTNTIFQLEPITVVLLNAILEIAGGTLLVMNIYTRWTAGILALHLGLITYEVGLGEIGVRDFGLTLATISLAMMSKNKKHTL